MKAHKITIQAPVVSGLESAQASARAGAMRAARIAADAILWAERAGTGLDDAAEALQAAHRARHASDRAGVATTEAEAASLARLAWAACTSVSEASGRVNAAIVELIVA